MLKEKLKSIWFKLRSMRVQVFFVMVCMGMIPVIMFSRIVIRSYNSQIISQKTEEVKSYGNILSGLILSSGYLSGQESDEVVYEAEEIANVCQGRVVIIDQNLKIVEDTYGLETGNTAGLSAAYSAGFGADCRTNRRCPFN